MTELRPDRLPTAAGSPRPVPVRRQGETSPSGDQGSSDPRPGARRRPVPHRRSSAPPAGSAAADPPDRAVLPTGDTAVRHDLPAPADAPALTVVATVPPGDAAPGHDATRSAADGGGPRRPHRGLRRPRRRPALYLAAVLVGAMGVGVSSTGDRVARADGPEPVSGSVSVARELGLDGRGSSDAAEAAVAAGLRSDVAVLLGEVTASRTAREAEEAAAAQVQAEADRIATEAAAAAAAEAARPRAVLPVAGARLTSAFGARWGRLHAGIDLAAPMLTPEYAAADGVVLEAGPASGYGNVVYVQHGNGDVTVYGHMEEILVQPGQVVRAGETIALLGNRGRSTGPHLHFEVHLGGIDGQKVDPVPWLRERGVAI